MNNRTSKYYWFCQILGWSFIGLSMLYFSHIFARNVDAVNLGRIVTVVFSGIISTHLLRAFLKSMQWYSKPIEKVMLKLMIVGFATTFVSILFKLCVYQVFNLFEIKLSFITRIISCFADMGIFVFSWTLIYYFYHYYHKTCEEEIQTKRLQRLLRKKESEVEKSNVDVDFIENSLQKIKGLIEKNPAQARKEITDFSNILRNGHLKSEH
jgi:two-component system LytT family sensor kinase